MKKILLLHGALGSKDQFQPLIEILNKKFEIFTFNFKGHGRESISTEDFSIELFSNQVIKFLDENKIDTVNIFGYSMGGYVGIALASKYRDRIESVFTLGTKYIWTQESAYKETELLNPELILNKVPKFADILKSRHSIVSWIPLLEKTAVMMLKLPELSDYYIDLFKQITIPVLIAVGDKDLTAGLSDSLIAHQFIPASSFCVLPSTTHPIEKVNLELLVLLFSNFIEKSTILPIKTP
jgi:pimeloyl-ACP methyl ester carboxylesterase